MKSQLFDRIRPLTDQLAEDLAGVVAARVESAIASAMASVDEAFGIALSALAGDQPESGGGCIEGCPSQDEAAEATHDGRRIADSAIAADRRPDAGAQSASWQATQARRDALQEVQGRGLSL